MSAAPPIDLRSDTVTRPTPAMRRAMAEAEVGDDVLDGDPTTRRLEQRVAEILGVGDALFFPSGSQANLTGIALGTERGTELILEANAHILHYEMAGVAGLLGVQIRPVQTPDGRLSADLVRGALRPVSPHLPRVSAITVENTHNLGGGRVTDLDRLAGIVALGREAGLALHLDGARLWNAAAALGVPPARIVRGFDTIMVSFSKGLGCPVGSCLGLAGARRAAAWEIRKRLGGGMRQSGVLAAAGLYALDHHLPDIPRDHEHARLLAERLGSCAGVRVETPESNIVMIDLVRERDDIQAVNGRLQAAGVRVAQYGPRRLRAVTHRDVDRAQIERAADILAAVLA
ncbi:MAG TPA: GntG family PLP-dependent aldolase [Gemmatimonadales bacterium]